jgi:hypothetical protein
VNPFKRHIVSNLERETLRMYIFFSNDLPLEKLLFIIPPCAHPGFF